MKITKLTIKIFLVISLFSSIALADGQMGGGGFADDGQMSGGGVADDGTMGNGGIADDGQMGGGGIADSIKIFVKEYLASLLG